MGDWRAKAKSLGKNGEQIGVRPALFVIALIVGAFSFGIRLIASGDPVGMRLLGVALIAGGLLLGASFVLIFVPETLQKEAWSRTLPRRVARWVLTHAWLVAIIACMIAWLIATAPETFR